MTDSMDLTEFLVTYYLAYCWYVILRAVLKPVSDNENGRPAQTSGEQSGSSSVRRQPTHSVSRDSTHACGQPLDEQDFLEGATEAFEIVLNAYVNKDLSILETFCSGEVVGSFASDLIRMQNEHQQLNLVLISVQPGRILATDVSDDVLEVTVAFDAEMIRSLDDSDCEAPDWSSIKAIETRDLWTFRRQPMGSSPRWKVVATRPG
ncbi:Tim44/TimA family putative adaptor protein [Pseudorhizobium flavum]|uniref:Tim44/TimA family putative adaptor protein n=1 Tax=Pseudorhizobium flavum TaxID=1335061 RepID=UPI0037705892